MSLLAHLAYFYFTERPQTNRPVYGYVEEQVECSTSVDGVETYRLSQSQNCRQYVPDCFRSYATQAGSIYEKTERLQACVSRVSDALRRCGSDLTHPISPNISVSFGQTRLSRFYEERIEEHGSFEAVACDYGFTRPSLIPQCILCTEKHSVPKVIQTVNDWRDYNFLEDVWSIASAVISVFALMVLLFFAPLSKRMSKLKSWINEGGNV